MSGAKKPPRLVPPPSATREFAFISGKANERPLRGTLPHLRGDLFWQQHRLRGTHVFDGWFHLLHLCHLTLPLAVSTTLRASSAA